MTVRSERAKSIRKVFQELMATYNTDTILDALSKETKRQACAAKHDLPLRRVLNAEAGALMKLADAFTNGNKVHIILNS
jgi:hypothetical protein